MKKILLLAMVLLVGCSNQNNGCTQGENEQTRPEESLSATTELNTVSISESSDIKNSENNSVLSHEILCKEIEEYFRMFYDKNESFNIISKGSTVSSPIESRLTGYFYKNSLMKLTLSRFGEQRFFFDEYYIINSDLIYCVQTIRYTRPNEYTAFKEEYNQYYFTNGKTYQINLDKGNLITCLSDNNELYEYFETSLNDIEANVLYDSQYDYCISEENALFSENSSKKADFFADFYEIGEYEIKNFTADFSDNKCESNNITAFYNENDLKKIRLLYPKEKIYTTYEYYIIDDDFIYIIVKNDIYDKNTESTNKSLMASSCQEFFIINGKVMKYNSDKQDLIEVSDETEILTNFNIAKDSIENSN